MSALDDKPRVEVETRAAWRAWLTANHDRSDGIWLVTFKKHCGERYLSYDAYVEEALCFGWIDSLPRKLDADRRMHYLCRRRPGSPWSGLNKRRVAQLQAAGLMTPAGQALIDQAKQDGSWTLLDDIEALIVPDDLAAALDALPGAAAGFEGFSKSAKRGLLWWIKSAKRAATRANRIEKTARGAAVGAVANQP